MGRGSDQSVPRLGRRGQGGEERREDGESRGMLAEKEEVCGLVEQELGGWRVRRGVSLRIRHRRDGGGRGRSSFEGPVGFRLCLPGRFIFFEFSMMESGGKSICILARQNRRRGSSRCGRKKGWIINVVMMRSDK
jgi:hypothetical protein